VLYVFVNEYVKEEEREMERQKDPGELWRDRER